MVKPYDPPRGVDGAVVAGDPVSMSIMSEPSDVIPVDLLGLFVTTEVWSAERTLAHVKRLAVPSDRSNALVCLAPHLPTRLLTHALGMATTVGWDDARAEALGGL